MKIFSSFVMAIVGWLFAFNASAQTSMVADSYTAADQLTDGFYVLKIRTKGTNGYMYYDGSKSRRFLQASESNINLNSLDAKFVWKLKNSTDGSFTLQNLASSAYAFVPKSTYTSSFAGDTEMNASTLAADAASFNYKTFTATNSLQGSVLLHQSNTTQYIHCNSWNDNGKTLGNVSLGYWENGEAGDDNSIVQFAFYALTLDAAKTLVSNATASHTANGLLQYSIAVDNEEAIKNATDLTSLVAVTFSSDAAKFSPEEGAYYRIYNNRSGQSYISSEGISVDKEGILSASGNILRYEEDDSFVPQLWQFEGADNGAYYIKNANVGQYFGSIATEKTSSDDASNNLQMSTSKTAYLLQHGSYSGTNSNGHTVDNSIQALLVEASNSHILHAYGGADIYNASGTLTKGTQWLGYWSGDGASSDPGSYWKIEKITEIPVTISGAGYASLALPFAVKVPDGVKAYTAGTIANGYVSLNEIESGVIPANTGVILEGSGTVNLTITTEQAASVDGNKLQPATARRTGFDANSTYVLALNSNNKPAFLQSELTVVPANKAYLLTTEIPSSDMTGAPATLNFTFGGTETGIGAVSGNDSEEQPTEFYDLQGRRVLFPTGGIFVTNTGKKVFIK